MKKELLDKIKDVSESDSSSEICGFMVKDKKNPLIFCKNVAYKKENNFEISAEEYLNIFKKKK